jgi:hypothetical protein
VDAGQLCDLMFDPNETHNVAADPAAAKIVAGMRGRLDEWMHATSDALLQGPVRRKRDGE